MKQKRRAVVRLPVEFLDDEFDEESLPAAALPAPAIRKNLFFPQPNPEQASDSLFSILRPSQKAPDGGAPKKNLFFPEGKPGESKGLFSFLKSEPKETEVRAGGDPFSAASQRPSRGEEPFVRKPGYSTPAFMSGPGDSTGLFENPAFWLIAGVATFVALEATGVTTFSKNLK